MGRSTTIRELRKQFEGKYEFQTESDCEVILALYQEKGTNFLDEMNGIFGFAIYDAEKDEYFIARDHMGIIPLYIGWDKHGYFLRRLRTEGLGRYLYQNRAFPSGTLHAQ